MIPNETIEEIKSRANIVEVIGDYVPLTRRGANYIGLCPFHSEKSPSFTVNDQKEIFYCFGCHKGGSVINFLMERDGLNFPEAVKMLGERYGVEIKETGVNKEVSSEIDLLLKTNKAALEFFYETFKASQNKAQNYFMDRGFNDEAAENFRVGYAPDSWDKLANFLKSKGLSEEDGFKAGLLGKKAGDGNKPTRYYDKFRDRLMFPITDHRGRVIAFGGRELDGSDPKYLNSPESRIFHKSDILYGFYQAKSHIAEADYAIVVEGYFDLIALYKAGFKNVVATMGTALTESHLRKLKPYSNKLFTLFDFDKAGKKATLRSMDIAPKVGVDVKVIYLTDGKDPDDFLNAFGQEALVEAIKEASPIMDFYITDLLNRHDINEARGKADFYDEVLKQLKVYPNIAEQSHYVKKVAAILDIEERFIFEALGKGVKGVKTKAAVDDRNTPFEKAENSALRDDRNLNLTELTFIKTLARHPEFFNDEVDSVIIKDEFLSLTGQTLKNMIKQYGRDIEGHIDEITDEKVRGFIVETVFEDDGFVEEPEKMFNDSMAKLQHKSILKPATLKQIEMLRDAGLTEEADKLEARYK